MQGKRLPYVAAALALVAALLTGCALNAECPCGSEQSDPLSEHDLSFDSPHVVQDECVCQCGDDVPFGAPRDRECTDYEQACVDEDGVSRTLVCE